jgi:hypothetical protein
MRNTGLSSAGTPTLKLPPGGSVHGYVAALGTVNDVVAFTKTTDVIRTTIAAKTRDPMRESFAIVNIELPFGSLRLLLLG